MRGEEHKNTMKGQKPFRFKNGKNIEYEAFIRKPYNIKECADGICEDPSEKDPRIYVKPNMSDQRTMNTMVHEMCHAFFFDQPEYKVYRYANAVSNWLWQMGWRKTGKQNINLTPKQLVKERTRFKAKRARKRRK